MNDAQQGGSCDRRYPMSRRPSCILSHWTVGLCALVVANVVVLFLNWAASTRPWYDLPGWSVHLLVSFRQGADSWGPMQEAMAYASEVPDGRVYREIFFDRGIKLQYPPSALLLIAPFTLHQLKWISAIVLFANVGILWAILERSLRLHGCAAAQRPWVDSVVRGAAVLTLGLLFYPLTVGFALGQIQTWLNALFAAVVWFALGRRDAAAGAAIGVMTWMKPHYALVAFWAALRGRAPWVASSVVAAAAGALAGVLRYGAPEHVDYLRVLAMLSRRGEAFYANQSVNGFLHRLIGNGDSLHFAPTGFPPFSPIVFAGTTVAFVALTALALWLPARWRQRGTAADLALFTVAITVASPIAWDHHYGVIAPAVAATVVPLVQTSGTARWTVPLLGVSWLLMATLIDPLSGIARPPLNIVQSYRLVGALVFAGLLLAHMKAQAKLTERRRSSTDIHSVLI